MIFEAFVVPTPRRIKRFFEEAINEGRIDMKTDYSKEIKTTKEEVNESKLNIEESEYSVKKLGFSVKIF